jgi:hypothetical protein
MTVTLDLRLAMTLLVVACDPSTPRTSCCTLWTARWRRSGWREINAVCHTFIARVLTDSIVENVSTGDA